MAVERIKKRENGPIYRRFIPIGTKEEMDKGFNMFTKVNEDLVRAMKEQDKFSLSVLRMLKSALQL